MTVLSTKGTVVALSRDKLIGMENHRIQQQKAKIV
jgi:hypothetical protein